MLNTMSDRQNALYLFSIGLLAGTYIFSLRLTMTPTLTYVFTISGALYIFSVLFYLWRGWPVSLPIWATEDDERKAIRAWYANAKKWMDAHPEVKQDDFNKGM